MSISNESAIKKNPAKKFITFKGGEFQYYDKETQANIPCPLPFNFVVLDTLAMVTGYDESNNCGIYSNEVKRTSDTELTVKSFKGGEIAKGLYSEIKDKVKSRGGRYTTSLYAMYNKEIVNIRLTGAALSSWIGKDFNENGISVTKLEDGQKGATKYKIPVFESVEVTGLKEAKALDVELQQYLGGETKEVKNPVQEIQPDDLPF